MFTSDIDLLTVEPNLFADTGWSGQRLVSASGTLSGTTLTLAGTDLEASAVEAGCVVLMSGVPLEVVDRLSTTTLKVSVIRWGRTGPTVPPVGLSTGVCEVWTFRPQIALAHRHVLRLLGLTDQADTEGAGVNNTTLGDSSVINPGALTMLESLLALNIIYAAAGAGAPTGGTLADKSKQYALRAGAERTRVAAMIDTNGDGLPDAIRRASVIPLLRS